jgi:hypothetical protein
MSWSGCVQGNCASGQGTNTWPDGEIYVGQWKNYKRDGQGTNTRPDGEKYVGQWKDNKYDGQGTLTWPDGTKYVGQWKNHKRNGNGTVTYPSGSKQSGIWQKGVYFGTIVEYEKAEKKRIVAAKLRRRVQQEVDDQYDKIYNACLLDKGSSVDMQSATLARAVVATCTGIAEDPSWIDSIKYN